jgi:hypothetical protein
MSRRTRRRLLLTLAVTLTAVVLGAWLLWPSPSAITEENYDRLRPGMTLEEVEALLGGPAGNYGYHGTRIVQTRDDIDVPRVHQCRYLQWVGARHMIGIQFDAEDRVIGKDLGEVTPLPLWRRPLSWLRL